MVFKSNVLQITAYKKSYFMEVYIFYNTLEFLKIFSGHFSLTQADVIKDHCT